jgi:hypothetical protein
VTWWLRSRLDRAAWAVVLVGVVATPLLGASAMPVLRLGVGPAPFSVVLPALTAAGVVGVLRAGDPLHEARSVRPTGSFARLLVLAVVLAAAGVWAVTGAVAAQQDLTVVAVRNLVGYLGVGLLAVRFTAGPGGEAAPLLYAVVVAVLGSPTAPWSWPLHGAPGTTALAATASLFAAGLLVGAGRGAARAAALRTG